MIAVITSIDPAFPFTETCKTFVVNAHGGAILSRQPLSEGLPVRIALPTLNRAATGHVLNCGLVTAGIYAIGIRLDVPGNFGGVDRPPSDWPQGPYEKPPMLSGTTAVFPTSPSRQPDQVSKSSGATAFTIAPKTKSGDSADLFAEAGFLLRGTDEPREKVYGIVQQISLLISEKELCLPR